MCVASIAFADLFGWHNLDKHARQWRTAAQFVHPLNQRELKSVLAFQQFERARRRVAFDEPRVGLDRCAARLTLRVTRCEFDAWIVAEAFHFAGRFAGEDHEPIFAIVRKPHRRHHADAGFAKRGQRDELFFG